MAESVNQCCPIGSEPKLAATYTPRGKLINVNDLPVYTIGEGNKVIIIITDVFGYDSGRSQLISDQFADEGFRVLLPDLFRGDNWNSDDWSKFGEWVKKFLWEKLERDFTENLFPYLEGQGVKSIGMVGMCWGDYIVFKASSTGKVTAGVGFHPTLNRFPETTEQLAEAVKCPQFLMPAGNDPEDIKEGGAVEKILTPKFGDKFRIKTFPDVNHGWVPRGDLSKPEVARDVKEAMRLAVDYFKELL